MSRPPGHPILPRLHGNGPNNGQRGVHPLKTSTSTSKLYVSWVDFRSVVQGITRLLGYSPLARGWESSVLKPLKDKWDGENTDTQEKLLARANDCKKRLSAVDSDERRGVDDYIVRGQIPPLQQLLIDLSPRRSTEYSEKMLIGQQWFPSTVRQRILENAKKTLQTIPPASYNGGDLAGLYRKAVDSTNELVKNDSVTQQCINLDAKLSERWPNAHLEEQMYSVLLFKTLRSFFVDISKHRVIAPALYGLWIPTPEEAESALEAVRQEAFDGFASYVRSLPPPSFEEYSAAPHRLHSTHASSGHASSAASSQLNSHGHHLDHHHPTYALSHSHSSLNYRMRQMYGVE